MMLCGQMLVPPQSLQLFLWRLCGQMLVHLRPRPLPLPLPLACLLPLPRPIAIVGLLLPRRGAAGPPLAALGTCLTASRARTAPSLPRKGFFQNGVDCLR